jgi:hypothetical protein
MNRSLFAVIFALFLASSSAHGADDTPQSNETKTVARIIARMATAGLSFKYKVATQEVIPTLDSADYFVFGAILDKDQNVLASYSRKEAISEKEKFLAELPQAIPRDNVETVRIDGDRILAIEPVKLNGEFLGYAVVARTAR